MTRFYITDRRRLPEGTLLDAIERNAAAGVEWIQIREKDLSGRELFTLVEAARRLTTPYGTKLLVNTRADIAVAAGADGVHLPDDSPPARLWRPAVPDGFLIGVSCHELGRVVQAQEEGADYVAFGPVFPPLSKPSALPPRGLEQLRQAAAAVRIPVLALGGITVENARACVKAGAAGIAGISLFQEP